MKTFILALLFCILPATVMGQAIEPEPPDITKWKVISSSNISIRVSDKIKYNLGFDRTYQNPDDPAEFARQISLLLPFIVIKSTSVLDKNFVDMALAYVTDGAEKELLKAYSNKSDPVFLIRWREKKDYVRETMELEGQNEVWFWDYSGTRIYAKDAHLKIYPLSESELVSDDKKGLVVVGLKYSLTEKKYRAHEVPHAFLVLAFKALKGGK